MLNKSASLSTPKAVPEEKQTKTKKIQKKNLNNSSSNMSYNKAKSHDTGLNCLSVATSDTGAYQRQTPNDVKQRHQRSLNSVGESEDSRSSVTLPDKPPVVSSLMTSSAPGDTSSIDELFTFDLDLGSSLLDEIMHVLDKTDF